jgi:cytochrome c oxidase cbb3-type subunit 3
MKRVRFKSVVRSIFLVCAVTTPARLIAQGDATAGAKTFSTNCSGCHGSDGRGGERAPNIATARNISSLVDKDLSNIVRNGVTGSGMPSFSFLGDRGIADVVAYLRVLQGKTSDAKITGNPETGHALFFGQAGCSTCHMVSGVGGFIASDLTNYASGLAPTAIHKAIVEPAEVVPTGSQVVELVAASGQKVTGILRSEDNFNIIIQTRDGRFQRYAKSSLKKLDYTGRSLMPTDYKTRLSAEQLNDIVGYLMRSASTIDPANQKKRRDE